MADKKIKKVDLKTKKAVARDEENVTLRKDFIRCWLHANPTVSKADASKLYDALCKRFPNMTRGGHRGMVGRLQPWDTINHECPCCGLEVTGATKIKEVFGWRLYTYETKTKGTQANVYPQSQCPKCRSLTPEEREIVKGGPLTGERVNPAVDAFYTNRSDANPA